MPKVTIKSSMNGKVTSVKEYYVSDEQVLKIEKFFSDMNARKETIRKKFASPPEQPPTIKKNTT